MPHSSPSSEMRNSTTSSLPCATSSALGTTNSTTLGPSSTTSHSPKNSNNAPKLRQRQNAHTTPSQQTIGPHLIGSPWIYSKNQLRSLKSTTSNTPTKSHTTKCAGGTVASFTTTPP